MWNPKKGKEHHNWKGGKTLDSNGYVLVNVFSDPMFKGKRQIHEHRYIMAKHLDRILYTHEIVHHKNGIKTDNRLVNLEIIERDKHAALHHIKGLRTVIKERCCFQCKKPFFPYTSKSRQIFCSNKCAGIARTGIRTKPIRKRKCPFCRKIFEPIFNSENSKFCSIPCANKNRATIILERKCPQCGKWFYPCTRRNSSKQRFCSISCGLRNRSK